MDPVVALEYFDTNTNVKLIHVAKQNVGEIILDSRLSDLHYSGEKKRLIIYIFDIIDPFFDGMQPIVYNDNSVKNNGEDGEK